MSSIDALALAGGRFGEIDFPCPICGPLCKTPSNRIRKVLRVWRAEPDFARYKCQRCGIHGHSRDDRAAPIDQQERQRRRAQAERQDANDRRDRTRRALAIWSEAELIGGFVDRYLLNRGIDPAALPDDMSHVLRWHPRCPWEGRRARCIVALWTEVATGEARAIHRTALTEKAERIDRMSLGPTAGCAIRLWPDEDVTDGLVIGEGIETVLSTASRVEHEGTRLAPAWACGDKNDMAAFPVLAGIESLTLRVDNDRSGAGQAAAATCAERWCAAGREVIRLTPRKPGADFNDLVVAR